jgi:hypothetical protein
VGYSLVNKYFNRVEVTDSDNLLVYGIYSCHKKLNAQAQVRNCFEINLFYFIEVLFTQMLLEQKSQCATEAFLKTLEN